MARKKKVEEVVVVETGEVLDSEALAGSVGGVEYGFRYDRDTVLRVVGWRLREDGRYDVAVEGGRAYQGVMVGEGVEAGQMFELKGVK